MLILTRKIGETILVDNKIEICILEVSNGNVRLGIKAPENVKIIRKELIKEIKEENEESVKNTENFIRKIK